VTRPEAEIAELPTDPGARLRRQRELAGLGAQQVAERLNLDPGVVVALESDDYAALGAPVFVRGHLRRYASLLGLASDEILGAYDRSRAQLAQPTLVPKSREEMAPTRGRFASPWLLRGAVAFLVAVGIAAYLGAYGLHLPIAREASGRGAAAGVGAIDDAVQGSPAPQGAGAATAVPPGQVGLAFDFAADSWIEVYDGSGKAILYDLGKAGTRRTVSGIAPLSVTLGNAPGVALSVNGRQRTMPPPPSGQTVARFGVGPDGSLR
jgi:cytoskeleton protein RodZ